MKCLLTSYFLVSIICLGFVACQSGNKPMELDAQAHVEAQVERTFERGKIIDPLTLEGRALETYALYLPKNYLTGYTWPTILFFDPQGNGKKPLELYKDLADQFGFILIGSNFSRNGKSMEEVLAHINALKSDLPGSIKADPFRIFLVGFSGGARVAVAEAMTNGDVAGVVGCGAGFPHLKDDVQLSFNYMAMVGKQDFNYSEFVVLDKQLSARNSNHILFEFEGKHAWPVANQMLEAFKWMTVYSYSQGEVIDMVLMDSLYQSDMSHLIDIENSADLRTIAQLYKKMIALYNGLANVTEQEKRLKMLIGSTAYQNEDTELEAVLAKEMKLRNTYMLHMNQKNYDWWTQDISEIRNKIAVETDLSLKNSRKRLLAYLSIASYLQAEASLKKDLLPQANKFLRILDLVDPKNPDYYYLAAQVLLKQGQNEKAVDLLKKASSYGFDNWEKLDNERVFDPIRSYLRTIRG